MRHTLTLRLSSSVHFARIGGQMVALDIRRDLYLHLNADQVRTLTSLSLRATAALPRWLEPLLDPYGIPLPLHLGRQGRLNRLLVPTSEGPAPRATMGATARALWLQAASGVALRAMSLQMVLGVLAHQRKRRGALLPAESIRLHSLLHAHRRAALLGGSATSCLRRAIALALDMASHDIAATLVFGVKLDPFGAHAWVRVGDMLVGDTIDHVRLFTPIFEL